MNKVILMGRLTRDPEVIGAPSLSAALLKAMIITSC